MESSMSRSALAVDTRRFRHCTKVDDAESVTVMEEFEFEFSQQTNRTIREREKRTERNRSAINGLFESIGRGVEVVAESCQRVAEARNRILRHRLLPLSLC